jgi:hypothetical protein
MKGADRRSAEPSYCKLQLLTLNASVRTTFPALYIIFTFSVSLCNFVSLCFTQYHAFILELCLQSQLAKIPPELILRRAAPSHNSPTKVIHHLSSNHNVEDGIYCQHRRVQYRGGK